MTAPTLSWGFSRDIEDYYAKGYCWYFVLSLLDKANFEVLAVWDPKEIHHVGIKLPTGQIVDIYGIWTREDWMEYWEQELLKSLHAAKFAKPKQTDPYWASACYRYANGKLTYDENLEFTLEEVTDIVMNALKQLYDLDGILREDTTNA